MDPFTFALARKADSFRRTAAKPAARPFRSQLRQAAETETAAEAEAATAGRIACLPRNSFGYPVLPAAH